MRERTIIKIFLDKVILIFLAVIILLIGAGGIYFLESYLNLSNGWVMFVLNCSAYIFTTLCGAFTMTFKIYRKTLISFLILFIIIGIFLLGGFLIFYLEILPLPKSIYLIAIIFLSAVTILIFEYCLRRTESSKL